jgi:hypothetical protein
MINHVTGPNGSWTERMTEHDVELLFRMGFIEKDGEPTQPIEEHVDGEWRGVGLYVQFWIPVDNRPTAG